MTRDKKRKEPCTLNRKTPNVKKKPDRKKSSTDRAMSTNPKNSSTNPNLKANSVQNVCTKLSQFSLNPVSTNSTMKHSNLIWVLLFINKVRWTETWIPSSPQSLTRVPQHLSWILSSWKNACRHSKLQLNRKRVLESWYRMSSTLARRTITGTLTRTGIDWIYMLFVPRTQEAILHSILLWPIVTLTQLGSCWIKVSLLGSRMRMGILFCIKPSWIKTTTWLVSCRWRELISNRWMNWVKHLCTSLPKDCWINWGSGICLRTIWRRMILCNNGHRLWLE